MLLTINNAFHVLRPLQELYLSKQNVRKAGGAEAAVAHDHFSIRWVARLCMAGKVFFNVSTSFPGLWLSRQVHFEGWMSFFAAQTTNFHLVQQAASAQCIAHTPASFADGHMLCLTYVCLHMAVPNYGSLSL